LYKILQFVWYFRHKKHIAKYVMTIYNVKSFLRKKTLLIFTMKLYNWNERNSFFCFQQPEKLLITKTSVRTIVITAKKWELFASKVVQLMHDTRLYTQLTASFPLSLSPCHRARSVLFAPFVARIGSRKLDDQLSSDFTTLTCKTRIHATS